MQTHLAHMQFNVRPEHVPFYKELLGLIGWSTLYETDGMIGAADPNGTSLWFIGEVKDVANDYDGPGMNHVAFGAASQVDVDQVAAFLGERAVAALFETPRHRPEFSGDAGQTYYQVMFETPDRILVEVVYTGPKSA
jgi:catechol 2,3-dioxygenase-like lactoylglutathione lyase family enzyme